MNQGDQPSHWRRAAARGALAGPLIWLVFTYPASFAIAISQLTGPGVVRPGYLAFIVVWLLVVTWVSMKLLGVPIPWLATLVMDLLAYLSWVAFTPGVRVHELPAPEGPWLTVMVPVSVGAAAIAGLITGAIRSVRANVGGEPFTS